MNATSAPAETFESMWTWLVDLAFQARMRPEDVVAFNKPGIIHAWGGDREGWGIPESEAIAGMPFSRPMASFLARSLPQDVVDALETINCVSGLPSGLRAVRRAQYRIVAAVLRHGHVDIHECQGNLQMEPFAFEIAARNGILSLRSALKRG